jgi:hypothetical protein
MDPLGAPLAPALDLGPLPTDLVEHVLLLLSPVERILVERVSKGWLAYLRQQRLWRVLDIDAVTDDLVSHGFEETWEFVHHLAKHAGASLRIVSCSHYVTDKLTDVLLEHCPNVDTLSLSQCVSAMGEDPQQDSPADYLISLASGLPLVTTMELGTFKVAYAFERGQLFWFLDCSLPSCDATIELCCIFDYENENGDDEDEQEEEDEDDGTMRLLNLAAFICDCDWKRLSIVLCKVRREMLMLNSLQHSSSLYKRCSLLPNRWTQTHKSL